MVDHNMVAIADCLRHPNLGVVTHQPELKRYEDPEILRVMDSSHKVSYVLAEKCEWATEEERDQYWKELEGNMGRMIGWLFYAF